MRRALLYSRSYRNAVMALGPVAYWRLGEASGTVARGEAGAHNGTYTNAPTLGVAGALAADPDTAITLNGSTQYVEMTAPGGLPQGNTAWTLEAWVKTSDGGANRDIIGYGTTVSNGDITLGLTGGALNFHSHATSNSFGGSFANDAYHHLSLTYDGTTMIGYADGAQQGSPFSPAALNVVLSSGYIGVWFNFIAATIDEVAIYPRALTADEIARLYQIGRGF